MNWNIGILKKRLNLDSTILLQDQTLTNPHEKAKSHIAVFQISGSNHGMPSVFYLFGAKIADRLYDTVQQRNIQVNAAGQFLGMSQIF